MSNLSIKINLLKLQNAALVNITGKTGVTKKCIVIPVEDANLFVGEKSVYLDASAFEIREPKYDQTHLIKQSLDKDTYQAMTEDERNNMPILGGIKPFIAKAMEAQEDMQVDDETSDLPF